MTFSERNLITPNEGQLGDEESLFYQNVPTEMEGEKSKG